MTATARLNPLLASVLALAALAMGLAALPASADHHLAGEQASDGKICVGIVTGQNNHNWFMDAPALNAILDDAGRFETTIMVSPDKNDPDKAAKWEQFSPAFSDFDVVIVNYNDHGGGDPWPDRIKRAFEQYIAGGGRAYIFHAGNNPFVGWVAYEKMVGLLWRDSNYGKRLYYDDQGEQHIQDKGEGPGAGHGRRHAYAVQTHDTDHPVFKGLPARWMHAEDELYHGQRGPAEDMTVLLTAYSDPATGGTGVSEPILWTIPYGEGLVLTNVMGHWWVGQSGVALRCAGFQTVLTRSLEWLATGEVTQQKPDDFPGEDAVSLREDFDVEPLAYIYVPGQPGADATADCTCGHAHTLAEHNRFIAPWRQFAQMIGPVPSNTMTTE